MKIYIVHSSFYTNHYIDKVFDSFEKARKYVDLAKSHAYHYKIKEMELE